MHTAMLSTQIVSTQDGCTSHQKDLSLKHAELLLSESDTDQVAKCRDDHLALDHATKALLSAPEWDGRCWEKDMDVFKVLGGSSKSLGRFVNFSSQSSTTSQQSPRSSSLGAISRGNINSDESKEEVCRQTVVSSPRDGCPVRLERTGETGGRCVVWSSRNVAPAGKTGESVDRRSVSSSRTVSPTDNKEVAHRSSRVIVSSSRVEHLHPLSIFSARESRRSDSESPSRSGSVLHRRAHVAIDMSKRGRSNSPTLSANRARQKRSSIESTKPMLSSSVDSVMQPQATKSYGRSLRSEGKSKTSQRFSSFKEHEDHFGLYISPSANAAGKCSKCAMHCKGDTAVCFANQLEDQLKKQQSFSKHYVGNVRLREHPVRVELTLQSVFWVLTPSAYRTGWADLIALVWPMLIAYVLIAILTFKMVCNEVRGMYELADMPHPGPIRSH